MSFKLFTRLTYLDGAYIPY